MKCRAGDKAQVYFLERRFQNFRAEEKLAEQRGVSLWEEGWMPGRVFPGCVWQCCLSGCPSPVCSDQALVDRYSTWGGFNIKFTFFGIFGVTWDFDLAGRYSHILKSQHKHNTAIAVYSWIQMQTWCLLLVYTLNCHGACCLQSLGRNMQIEASVGPLFSSKFYLLIVCFLYFGLSHVYAPPILVWVAQEDIVLC